MYQALGSWQLAVGSWQLAVVSQTEPLTLTLTLAHSPVSSLFMHPLIHLPPDAVLRCGAFPLLRAVSARRARVHSRGLLL
jgi:hypothetical protein